MNTKGFSFLSLIFTITIMMAGLIMVGQQFVLNRKQAVRANNIEYLTPVLESIGQKLLGFHKMYKNDPSHDCQIYNLKNQLQGFAPMNYTAVTWNSQQFPSDGPLGLCLPQGQSILIESSPIPNVQYLFSIAQRTTEPSSSKDPFDLQIHLSLKTTQISTTTPLFIFLLLNPIAAWSANEKTYYPTPPTMNQKMQTLPPTAYQFQCGNNGVACLTVRICPLLKTCLNPEDFIYQKYNFY